MITQDQLRKFNELNELTEQQQHLYDEQMGEGGANEQDMEIYDDIRSLRSSQVQMSHLSHAHLKNRFTKV